MGNIKLFEDKRVRTVWSEAEEKWYFVVEDVVAILTDSKDPKQYISRLRQRDEELAKGWVQFVHTFAIVRTQNPEGFVQNRQAARQGGKIAGDARKALEHKTGESVVSEDNFLPAKKLAKKLRK
jgi:hypothetical protein